jgi:hypothetical protein
MSAGLEYLKSLCLGDTPSFRNFAALLWNLPFAFAGIASHPGGADCADAIAAAAVPLGDWVCPFHCSTLRVIVGWMVGSSRCRDTRIARHDFV